MNSGFFRWSDIPRPTPRARQPRGLTSHDSNSDSVLTDALFLASVKVRMPRYGEKSIADRAREEADRQWLAELAVRWPGLYDLSEGDHYVNDQKLAAMNWFDAMHWKIKLD